MAGVKAILDMLHPDVIGERVEYVLNMLRENYRVPKYIADDFHDCARIIVGFYQYLYAGWLGTDVVMPYELALSQVKELLSKKGGFANLVKNSLRGREGGLIGAIDSLVDSFKEVAVSQYVDGVVTHFVDPLDFELKMDLAEEYLEKYARHVLPNEELIHPGLLAANFESIIKYHVKWVVSYRQMMT